MAQELPHVIRITKQPTTTGVIPKKGKTISSTQGERATPGTILDHTYIEFGPINVDKTVPAVFCRYGGGGTGASEWVETKGGGGSVEPVKRPYLPTLTVWRGPAEPYTHKIPLLLDAFGEQENEKQYVKEQ